MLLTLKCKLTDGVTEAEGSDCVLIVDKGDYNCSDDGSGHKKKKKNKKKKKKKGHHGDDDSSGH